MGMKRGDLVSVSLPGDYGKPRPTLIIQSDFFNEHPSVTVLPLTSELRDAPLFRVTIEPEKENGLNKKSQVMVDKAHTVPYDEKVSKPFGKLNSERMMEISKLLALFLGFA
jgi:mRNA interferase MazF